MTHNRYQYSILKVCEDLTSTSRGSAEGLHTDEEFQAQADWLRSRLDNWEESLFLRCRAYDNAVHTLACTALNEWNDYRRKVNQ